MNRLEYTNEEFDKIRNNSDCQLVERTQYLDYQEFKYVFFHAELKQHYMFTAWEKYLTNTFNYSTHALACEPVEIHRIEWRVKS